MAEAFSQWRGLTANGNAVGWSNFLLHPLPKAECGALPLVFPRQDSWKLLAPEVHPAKGLILPGTKTALFVSPLCQPMSLCWRGLSQLSLCFGWLGSYPSPAWPWSQRGVVAAASAQTRVMRTTAEVLITAIWKHPCCWHSEHCWGSWTPLQGPPSAALASRQYWATQPLWVSYTAHTFGRDPKSHNSSLALYGKTSL